MQGSNCKAVHGAKCHLLLHLLSPWLLGLGTQTDSGGTDVSTSTHNCSQLSGFLFTQVSLILQKHINSDLDVCGTFNAFKLLCCCYVMPGNNT